MHRVKNILQNTIFSWCVRFGINLGIINEFEFEAIMKDFGNIVLQWFYVIQLGILLSTQWKYPGTEKERNPNKGHFKMKGRSIQMVLNWWNDKILTREVFIWTHNQNRKKKSIHNRRRYSEPFQQLRIGRTVSTPGMFNKTNT